MAVAESPREVILEKESTHVPIATAHFTMKAQQARDAKASVQRALTFDEMELSYDGDEEAQASKTLRQHGGPSPHQCHLGHGL